MQMQAWHDPYIVSNVLKHLVLQIYYFPLCCAIGYEVKSTFPTIEHGLDNPGKFYMRA